MLVMKLRSAALKRVTLPPVVVCYQDTLRHRSWLQAVGPFNRLVVASAK